MDYPVNPINLVYKMYITHYQNIGAQYDPGNNVTHFAVWSPTAKKIELQLLLPNRNTVQLKSQDYGYWNIALEDIPPGTNYYYIINGKKTRPDPASRYQPDGVHGPSQVIDTAYSWNDTAWKGIPLQNMIIYELHIGTFTSGGTFDSAMDKLNYLRDLGVNTIEIMPVAQFPGKRNWGYDGVYPFAVQNSYGGPEKLKQLVDACHQNGMAVILDVVYNHQGPEGNYFKDFAPYFTGKYNTPWGEAINFDDVYADGVRSFYIQNALMWLRDYHIDGLRLDAIHAIWDFGAKHILEELKDAVADYSEQTSKQHFLIAESDLNDPKFLSPKEKGGFGLDAQWTDEFHHALHALLTGETGGYYADFGKVSHLAKAFTNCYVNDGQYSFFKKKTYGRPVLQNPANQFVVYTQTHDQTGNRMFGERLIHLCGFETAKLAAATLFLAPYIPMLFMGEEYGEKQPFLYFTDHSDKYLTELVRKGRKQGFKVFKYKGDPIDPGDLNTFLSSKLSLSDGFDEKQQALFRFYKMLISLRKDHPVLSQTNKQNIDVNYNDDKQTLVTERWEGSNKIIAFMNFSNDKQCFIIPYGNWHLLYDSAGIEWVGTKDTIERNIGKDVEIIVFSRSVIVLERLTTVK